MPRAPRLLLAVLLTVGTASACSEGTDEGPAPAAGSATTSERPDRYAVELEIREQPGPESGSPPSSASPSEEPGRGPLQLVVTNTGTAKDAYLVRVVPPEAGGVAPATVELDSGEEAVVRLVVVAAPDSEVEVVAVSRGTGDVLATLEVTTAG